MVYIPADKIVCFCFFIIFYFRNVFAAIMLSFIKLSICVNFSLISFIVFFIIFFTIFFCFFFVSLFICFSLIFVCFSISLLVSFPFFSHSFLLHMNILTLIIVDKVL